MSRIGKKPIEIPGGVELTIDDGTVTVRGPLGELQRTLRLADVSLRREDGQLLVERREETRYARSEQGLTRTLIQNMVEGVTKGYTRTLLIEGTGFRAQPAGQGISIALGYTHPVVVQPPEGVTIEAPQPTRVVVKGIDKEKVGQVAATIRYSRDPDPYKMKGVIYEGEKIRRKVGKAGAK